MPNIPENNSLKTIDDGQYFRMPDSIPTDCYWMNTFGHSETETSARMLVKFCQKQGDWSPMKREDLDKFDTGGTFYFHGLDDCKWIVNIAGMIFITEAFVDRCFHKVKK